MDMSSSDTTYVLSLERDQNFDSTLFRFCTGSKIRLTLGASLLGLEVHLFTNIPKSGQSFSRNEFNELKWEPAEIANAPAPDNLQLHVDVKFEVPGTFRYKFTVSDNVRGGNGYFIVDPDLKIGKGVPLPLNAIQCQTVLSKNLGDFDSWKLRLDVTKEAGYNMIHFTPIQELGASNSAYSISNQLKVNPSFGPVTFDEIKVYVEKLRDESSILSIMDIVLNHTANETPWLTEHPEVGYNMVNCPHLRPAFLFDRVLYHLTVDIAAGKWASKGLKQVKSEEDLFLIRETISKQYLPFVRIEEMFQVDVDSCVAQFKKKFANASEILDEPLGIKVVQDPEYRRLKSCANWDNLKFAKPKSEMSKEEIAAANGKRIREELELLNKQIKAEIDGHLDAGVENVIRAIRYERLQADGPKVKELSKSSPLVTAYFTFDPSIEDLEREEVMMYIETGANFMAHNGWVMNFDPLKNFAAPGSNIYLRRELIAWGDSVKLRYGSSPEDCPFLWNLMKQYVEKTAEIFDGIRLDNCHSTPLEVAEYLIDAARKVRPNLYVIAELFTSSEHLDNIFVNRLGINSLIRESMACHDSHELGRLVHRFGGDPVGAFSKLNFRPLTPSMAHAIFFDATHDNESMIEKRSPYDPLASAAVIAMSASATGSNRGFDELVPHHIHVVKESRLYKTYTKDSLLSTGIVPAKKILNHLHSKLALEGFNELFVDQVDVDTLAITRHNPQTHKSVILIARTCFTKQSPLITGFIRSIPIAGKINQILFEGKMVGSPDGFIQDPLVINGIPEFFADLRQNIPHEKSSFISVVHNTGINHIRFEKFTPSTIVAFDVQLAESHLKAIELLRKASTNDVKPIITELKLEDLNYCLFRCDREERDEFPGCGVYNIPGFTDFVYCGLGGLMYYWRDIRTKNDLGHPICQNLREGDWLPEYIAARLKRRPRTHRLGEWFSEAFSHLSQIPRYMIPRYFDTLVTPVYSLLIDACTKQFSSFVRDGSILVDRLVLGSVALVSFHPSSPLPPLSPSMPDPKPSILHISGIDWPTCPTISAGLPHFSSGYMKNWGRDTFISLRGLLLVTGRWTEARDIILGFGGCLRHGLIPNLLDKGLNARYNCRDAVWFWLQSIKDYCSLVKDGTSILTAPVRRLYPYDDSDAQVGVIDQPLHQVMQEALLKHFRGIEFKERNWGVKIDEQMTEEGFHVTAGVSRETGFVFGGNEWNCGTWMDKMGSSAKAGNRGKPSSPRDGSAIELVGLCYSVVSWLDHLFNTKLWPYDGVSDGQILWKWKDWADRMKEHFEPNFWVDPEDRQQFVNKKSIYKDTFGATQEWQDYQLRPNIVIAMAVAPELFSAPRAQACLDVIESLLLSPLGMKTLDPTDWNYNGDYNNSDDSTNYKTAHGFNYHQGPEWIWPLGYYLRARLTFAKSRQNEKRRSCQVLAAHLKHLMTSPWMGLPELTNSNGSYCAHGCDIQAWSHSTILDYLFDAQN